MTYVTRQDSTAFVASVTVARPPVARPAKRDLRAVATPAAIDVPAPPVALQDKTAQAVVGGAGIILAEQGVGKAIKDDILNCTLFAQFAASQTVASPTDVGAWYDAYFSALRKIGWSLTSQEFREYKQSGTTLQVHKAVVGVLTTLLGDAATGLAVAQSVFSGLEQVGSDVGWLILFNREATSAKVAKFQVVTAQPTPGGQVNIALVAFELRAKKKITQILFFKHDKAKVKLKFAGGTATVYEQVLATVRDDIRQALAAVAVDYVRTIDIPTRAKK